MHRVRIVEEKGLQRSHDDVVAAAAAAAMGETGGRFNRPSKREKMTGLKKYFFF